MKGSVEHRNHLPQLLGRRGNLSVRPEPQGDHSTFQIVLFPFGEGVPDRFESDAAVVRDHVAVGVGIEQDGIRSRAREIFLQSGLRGRIMGVGVPRAIPPVEGAWLWTPSRFGVTTRDEPQLVWPILRREGFCEHVRTHHFRVLLA